MKFAVELLSKLLERRQIAVSFPGLALTAQDLLGTTYDMLLNETP